MKIHTNFSKRIFVPIIKKYNLYDLQSILQGHFALKTHSRVLNYADFSLYEICSTFQTSENAPLSLLLICFSNIEYQPYYNFSFPYILECDHVLVQTTVPEYF